MSLSKKCFHNSLQEKSFPQFLDRCWHLFWPTSLKVSWERQRMQKGVFLKSSGAGQLDKLRGSQERMQQGVSLKSSRAREQDHIWLSHHFCNVPSPTAPTPGVWPTGPIAKFSIVPLRFCYVNIRSICTHHIVHTSDICTHHPFACFLSPTLSPDHQSPVRQFLHFVLGEVFLLWQICNIIL